MPAAASHNSIPTLQPIVRELARLFVDAVREELANMVPDGKSAISRPVDVARELKVSPATVRAWCKAGKLGKDVSQPGSQRPQWVIHQDDLDNFLKTRQAEQKPTKKRRPARDTDVIEFFS